MNRAALIRLLRPLFGIGLLVFLISQVDVASLWPLLQRGDPLLLACSLTSFVASLCAFQALRLHVLVAHYTGGLGRSMRLFFVGAFFNNLLPSNVGGDAVRLLYLSRMKDGTWTGPLALLLLHRLSGIGVMLAFFALYVLLEGPRLSTLIAESGISVQGPSSLWFVALLGVIVGGVAGLLVLRRTAFGQRVLARLFATAHTARSALAELSTRVLVELIVLTVLFHGARMVGFYFAVLFFGQSIALWDLVPVLTFTAVMAMVPITVGGLGLVEGSVGAGLGLFGVDPSVAVATALVNRLSMVLVALIGGVMYAADRDQLQDTNGPR